MLKPRKKARIGRVIAALCGGCSSCGLKNNAHSAGLKVNETKAEMIVAVAIVTANWRKNWPEMPGMKAEGMNTADSTSAMATSGVPTSSVERCAAARGLVP